jgi:vacuolar-type H+-ATPase subunit I/STV1
MSLKHDFANGLISLVIGVAITKATASDEESYDLSEVLMSVAVASFFSGFFTSYFAKGPESGE